MTDLRAMIIERIADRGPGPMWILDSYYHLISSGIAPDKAMQALTLFVDEVVEKKRQRLGPLKVVE
ncbi:hypothetical protein QIH96_12970 [Bradyrhizobium japonicum]|uniref:hypothetical protein n=1 Tax=Bradyrhizobium japonicum TaxID=375 RepID=UPI0027147633|nr:hypothetical protein [Bradyrhizobium japonicum]WLB66012.1 hypothetical protein QIH96_12970 [Bradyrhizobium japonicum]